MVGRVPLLSFLRPAEQNLASGDRAATGGEVTRAGIQSLDATAVVRIGRHGNASRTNPRNISCTLPGEWSVCPLHSGRTEGSSTLLEASNSCKTPESGAEPMQTAQNQSSQTCALDSSKGLQSATFASRTG